MKIQYAFHEIKIINLKYDAKGRINYYRYLSVQLFKKIYTIIVLITIISIQFDFVLFGTYYICVVISLFFSYLFIF